MFAALQEVGRRHVRGEHAFLDQTVRVVALHRDDTVDLALVVEDHLGFDGFEVDRAAPDPRRGKDAKESL